MTDLAALAVTIDTRQARAAAGDLDALTKQAPEGMVRRTLAEAPTIAREVLDALGVKEGAPTR